jgi:hypothetical protein
MQFGAGSDRQAIATPLICGRGQEDGRNDMARSGDSPMQLGAAHFRHPNVRNQTGDFVQVEGMSSRHLQSPMVSPVPLEFAPSRSTSSVWAILAAFPRTLSEPVDLFPILLRAIIDENRAAASYGRSRLLEIDAYESATKFAPVAPLLTLSPHWHCHITNRRGRRRI